MDKKYRILILSNPNNEEFLGEDKYVADIFREDGQIVTMLWVDYDEILDDEFDIIIRRNAWVNTEEETREYKRKNDILIQRLKKKKIKTVNIEGLDGQGKGYLCKLFKEGESVIPTVDNINDIREFGDVKQYVLKDVNSFGSGLGQKVINASEIKKEFKEGYLIQPKLEFKSEVQCYFIGNKLMYAYEYVPSKYPDYPEPKEVYLTKEEEKLAYKFAKISGLKTGFLRIDFLRLLNNELILLEIEDNSPIMDLAKLNEKYRKQVLEEYKRNIYDYLEE